MLYQLKVGVGVRQHICFAFSCSNGQELGLFIEILGSFKLICFYIQFALFPSKRTDSRNWTVTFTFENADKLRFNNIYQYHRCSSNNDGIYVLPWTKTIDKRITCTVAFEILEILRFWNENAIPDVNGIPKPENENKIKKVLILFSALKVIEMEYIFQFTVEICFPFFLPKGKRWKLKFEISLHLAFGHFRFQVHGREVFDCFSVIVKSVKYKDFQFDNRQWHR